MVVPGSSSTFLSEVIVDARNDISSTTAQVYLQANGVASENNVAQITMECIGGGGGSVSSVISQRYISGVPPEYGLTINANGNTEGLQFIVSGNGNVGIGRQPSPYNSGSLEISGNLSVPALVGSFTANGATPVPVANTNATASSVVFFSLKTAGGTPGIPTVDSLTAGTGFDAVSEAGDTSVWNYIVIG
jgi:hypothetical protein